MRRLAWALLTIFVITSAVYIKCDSERYEVKPCAVPSVETYTASTSEDFVPIEKLEVSEDLSEYTDEERKLLARAIMSEGGELPRHGKIAIMATIMNRVRSDKYPNTIKEVLTQKSQFSLADNGDPTEECYLAIDDYVPTGFPDDMIYFRADRPHSFGYEYLHIGNTYFSTVENHCQEVD